MDYQKLPIKRYPRPIEYKDAESSYWKGFRNTVHIKEFAPVTSVDFSPVKPHDFCVASSTRVQIYSTQSNSLKKTISRFQDVANCASFRQDGKLVVAGDSSGVVQVFDLSSRAILRSFKGHTAAVRGTRFMADNTNIVSISDDKSVRIWNLPSESMVNCWDNAHGDYIRSVAVSKTNPNFVVTAGYDHLVKVWDLRANVACVSLDHGLLPVESVLLFPGESVVASSAGSQVFIWDLLGGSSGRLLQTVSNHQKTITSMCFNSKSSRILTASLDHHVKIYDVSDYKVVYSLKYPSPVLSIGLSPDDSHLVAGMVSGLISVREKKKETVEVVPEVENIWALRPRAENGLSKHEVEAKARGGTHKFFLRGRHKLPGADDVVIISSRAPRLTAFERNLKKFEFSQALDSALSKNLAANVVVTLLEELKTMEGGRPLKSALSARSDVSLEPILNFIMVHIKDVRFSNLLVHVLDLILDMYSSVIYSSPSVYGLVKKIRAKTREEINLLKEMHQMMGVLDMVMATRK